MSGQGKKSIQISKRVRSWKAKCVSNGISYKEVIQKANLNYDSVINAMTSSLNGNTNAISEERMEVLEKAVLLLIIEKNLS